MWKSHRFLLFSFDLKLLCPGACPILGELRLKRLYQWCPEGEDVLWWREGEESVLKVTFVHLSSPSTPVQIIHLATNIFLFNWKSLWLYKAWELWMKWQLEDSNEPKNLENVVANSAHECLGFAKRVWRQEERVIYFKPASFKRKCKDQYVMAMHIDP